LFDQIEPRRQCLLGRPVCSDQLACEAHAQWKDVSERVARFFSETSVADLMGHEEPRPKRRSGSGESGRATLGRPR
jgi:DNA-binding IscR family transcriptional regulator